MRRHSAAPTEKGNAMAIHPQYAWRKISPDDGGIYLFGYYDRNPWNHDMSLHLAMRIPQETRLPRPGECADVGVIGPHGFEPLVKTRTWCHQQGCMELFLPRRPDCFVFNDFDTESGKPVARVFRLGHGIVGRYEWPIYAISPDGRYAVSLNFSRIPRRGYSYADTALSPDLHPADLDSEGLRLIDLETGASRIIVSYRSMIERHPYAYSCEGRHIWLNHAIFNRDSSRVLWLFRQCDEPGDMSRGWMTFLYTSSLSGEDAECVLPEACWAKLISHQIWGRTPREILVDAAWGGRGHDAVVFDESRRPFLAQRLSAGHGRMSHMVFSPDGRYILSDSYPQNGIQPLILIDAENGCHVTLGEFRHERPAGTPDDVRCDLHPRWSPDGSCVTVDSIHDGRRAIYRLDLPPAFAALAELR